MAQQLITAVARDQAVITTAAKHGFEAREAVIAGTTEGSASAKGNCHTQQAIGHVGVAERITTRAAIQRVIAEATADDVGVAVAQHAIRAIAAKDVFNAGKAVTAFRAG